MDGEYQCKLVNAVLFQFRVCSVSNLKTTNMEQAKRQKVDVIPVEEIFRHVAQGVAAGISTIITDHI
jgi:phosphoribosylaminoimidazole-succinocarboxamide synthase